MNFYKHHIGDYAKKTGALSMTEHGAYLLMLHAYYGTEKPLPFGRDLYRICRAFGKKERAAVDKVAALFWKQTDVGFVNGRAFEEIELASELSDIARENGSKGGRPKKPSGLIPENPVGLISKPTAKAIQTPDSRLQLRNKKKTEEAQAPVEGLDLASWDRWVTYRRESGKPIKSASVAAAQKKLAAFGTQQSAVVEESIANGYQGLFAPKTNSKGGKMSLWE